MSHNDFLELRGTNKVALQGLLNTIYQLQLDLYEEQDMLEKESKTYLKDWEDLQYKCASLELAKLNMEKAIRGLNSEK